MSDAFDWRRLAPHRPLEHDDEGYVPRPTADAARLAMQVRVDASPILVAGPVGVGKSTELVRVGLLLEDETPTWHVALDREHNMRSIDAESMLAAISVKAGGLMRFLLRRGAPLDICLEILREARPDRSLDPPVLLLDGLEKTPPERLPPLFDALRALLDDVRLVCIVPWQAIYGPDAVRVISDDERYFFIRPVATNRAEGLDFLVNIARHRLRADSSALRTFLEEAAAWSGGLPRTFLQIVAGAAGFARIAGAELPTTRHLADAVDNQRDFMRRLLLPGDTDALRAVDGTDGREMALDRKLRLLSHGLLLEIEEAGQPVMRPHPLVRPLLERPATVHVTAVG